MDKKKTVLVMCFLLSFTFTVTASAAIPMNSNGSKVLERPCIAEKDKWNLEDIYPSIEEWEKSFAVLSPRVDALA